MKLTYTTTNAGSHPYSCLCQSRRPQLGASDLLPSHGENFILKNITELVAFPISAFLCYNPVTSRILYNISNGSLALVLVGIGVCVYTHGPNVGSE